MTWALGWLELAVRWIHVIAGVAWIGTSFYFNWLNDRLEAPAEPRPGIDGELWSVHGGHFYRVDRFAVAPARIPAKLHWFKWEAYLTWLSGAALLVLVYYLGADVYMIDPGVSTLGSGAAVALGAGVILLGWVVYHALCRSPLARRPLAFGLLGLVLVAGLAYGLTELLSGRAAYIHVGVLLGTIMAANVFYVIIPVHHDLVGAIEAGEEPDAAAGKHAAMRSRHNNYFTLPVLFVMIANHYPITYGHAWNWAILLALFVIGVGTRHYFNLRNMGRAKTWIPVAVTVAMVALAIVSAPSVSGSGRVELPGLGSDESVDASGPVPFERVREIVVARCVTCHSATPSHALFDAPPAGVAFDTPGEIVATAEKIYQMTVATKVMPLGNWTEMTDEERVILGRWIRQGAAIE